MHSLVRVLLLVLALLMVAPELDARQRRSRKGGRQPAKTTRTVDKVRNEQTQTQRKISETATKIDRNDRELSRQLGRLEALNADIATQKGQEQRLRSRVDSLGGAIKTTSDSIALLETDLESLRRAYADAMAKIQPSASMLNEMTFLFSAKSYSEAWQRLRYLRRFAEWRQEKADAINRTIDTIASRRQHLTTLRHSQDVAFRRAEETRRSLQAKQDESARMVSDLRRQDSQLRAQLARQRKQAAALDRELDRLIAAEQERIAREEREARAQAERQKAKGQKDKGKSGASSSSPSKPSQGQKEPPLMTAAAQTAKLTGSFAQNKGRLLFPVAGQYRIIRRFGTQPHPTLRHVTVDNSGIDIQAPGATARAVFDGTVSAIIRQEGYDNIVMLRHGRYLTVYAGLGSVSVTNGQKVKAGQTLGRLAGEVLHFEVRNERTKLNPSSWVR